MDGYGVLSHCADNWQLDWARIEAFHHLQPPTGRGSSDPRTACPLTDLWRCSYLRIYLCTLPYYPVEYPYYPVYYPYYPVYPSLYTVLLPCGVPLLPCVLPLLPCVPIFVQYSGVRDISVAAYP